MWTCCNRSYSDGVKTCRVCKATKREYTTDGTKIIEKRESSLDRPQRNMSDAEKQSAKVVRGLPTAQDNETAGKPLYTSTLNTQETRA